MKKIVALIIIFAIIWVAWYLIAPLFIDKEVNEDFPQARLLSEEELFVMSEEEREAVRDEQMTLAASMEDKEMLESMPDSFELLKEGVFEGADSFHMGSGSASLYSLGSGERVLRFEDFFVTNGPDLRVVLAREASPSSLSSSDYVELAKMKGNKGNQNYEIPADINLEEFKSVVIYCKPFKVVFAFADLL